ncbi:C6 zinc finger domain protein [Cordyceps fumosorosea ARSEF 2679]|uniref:C6 zinc finger domain protein n=1 Tax=Cordyceps fumosorosea (strain ARSEF 2679) TaxID=1081104 RepID=A0A168B7H7_CORFA|nr:C6 zinc finger domain protein [Cordyceps fumosorosea ARSEF 2679]OAA69730.1 C6 zinc finger domain protein [Cordyceps fumosorosea ARSEF 2679]
MLVPLRPKPHGSSHRPASGRAEQARGSLDGISENAVPGSKPEPGQRAKRWAAKTRTGCLTCRERRVKCDEQKPFCKSCLDFGKECKGYQLSKDMMLVEFSIPGAPDHESLKLADPKVIRQEQGSGAFQSTRPSVKTHMVILPDAFIMRTVNHNIVTATQQSRCLPKHGTLPSIAHLWWLLYEYVASTMRELNRLISAGDDVDMILHYILSIFAIESKELRKELELLASTSTGATP